MCSALIIGFVCIVIGLPLWWFTTNVYRANLPYAAIEDLDKFEVFSATYLENMGSKSSLLFKKSTFYGHNMILKRNLSHIFFF